MSRFTNCDDKLYLNKNISLFCDVFLDALASLKTMLDIKSFIHSVTFSRFQDYRVLESIREYYRVLQSMTEYCRVLQSISSIAEYCRELQSIAE